MMLMAAPDYPSKFSMSSLTAQPTSASAKVGSPLGISMPARWATFVASACGLCHRGHKTYQSVSHGVVHGALVAQWNGETV